MESMISTPSNSKMTTRVRGGAGWVATVAASTSVMPQRGHVPG